MLSCFSHVRLCEPMDCSLTGFSVLRILQEGILESVAVPSSKKMVQMILLAKQKERHRYREQTQGTKGQSGWGELGLTYIHYYLQNRQLKRMYWIAQGTLLRALCGLNGKETQKRGYIYTYIDIYNTSIYIFHFMYIRN